MNRILQLALLRAYLGLKSESKRTYLGYLWWVLEPAIHLYVYYIVFDKLLQRGGEGFVAFLLVGVVHWLWFSKTVMNASQSILVGRGLIQQVYISKIVFPFTEILKDLVKQLVVITCLFLFLLGYGVDVSNYWFIYPLIFIVQFILIFFVAVCVAAVVPLLPDLRVVVPAMLQFLMFVSGIFFSRESVPNVYHWLLDINPMFVLLESYRNVLLYERLPDVEMLASMAGILLSMSFVLVMLVKRYDTRYARIVVQ